jgi:excisionase family DNA binding protein
MGTPVRDTDEWVTVRTFAGFVGASRVTVYRLFRARAIAGHKVGTAIRIRADFAADCQTRLASGVPFDLASFGHQWLADRQQVMQPAQAAPAEAAA